MWNNFPSNKEFNDIKMHILTDIDFRKKGKKMPTVVPLPRTAILCTV